MSAAGEDIGYSGTGNFTQSGGTNIAGSLSLANSSGSNGTYNLNGGTLILWAINSGFGTAVFNFGGGTLQANGTFSTAVPMTLTGSGGNATVDTAGYTVTLSGSLSGPGGLTKTDSGTLTLTGSDTYSGGTTLSAGQLNINATAALGTGTFTISGGTIGNASGSPITLSTNNAQTWNGDFIFAGTSDLNLGTGAITMTSSRTVTVVSNTLTVGGVISDSGSGYSLTMAGPGTLTLTGSDTYSGGTTLSGGQLNINAAAALGSGALTISGGTIGNTSTAAITLSTNNAQTWNGDLTFVGTNDLNLGTGAVTMNSGCTVTVVSNTLTIGGVISDSGSGYSLTKTGTGTLTLDGANTYTGGTTVNDGLLDFASSMAIPSGTGTITINSGGAVLVGGAYPTVMGWLNSNDINPASAGALALTTGTTSSETINMSGYASLSLGASGAVTYIGILTPAGTTYYLGGGGGTLTFTPALTGSYSLVVAGPGTVILTTTNNTYTGGTTITSGTLQLGDGATVNGSVGNITDNAMLTFANPAAQTYSGVISGSGSLTKTGMAALTIRGTNTYTGGTTVGGGTLQLGNAAALGSTSGAAAVSSGATLDLHGYNLGVGALFGTGIVNNLSGASTYTLTVGNGDASGTFSGTIADTTGTIALMKTGTGTLTLGGANTYTGGTTVNGGLLDLTSNWAVPSGTGTITINSGGAVLVGDAYTTVTGWLGSHNINTASTGALALTGTSSETINMGSYANLSLGASGAATYNGVLTPAGNTYRLGGGGGMLTFTPALTGSYSLVVAGPGTVVLTNTNNTYSGGTTLSAGHLNINTAAALGTGALTIVGGTLGNTSGRPITLSTNNAQIWSGDFTFTASTFPSNNTLNLGTGAVTMSSSRTVTVVSSSLTVGGVISDSGSGYSLTKAGPGTLILGGANTYSGGTTLSAGQLNINAAAALGTGALTISGGALGNTSGSPITLSTNNTQNWNGNFTFAGFAALNLGTGAVNMSSSRTVTVVSNSLTVGGVISDSGSGYSLTKAGPGTLTLGGANTYSGGTMVWAGTLSITNSSALGSGGLSLAPWGVFNLNAQNCVVPSLSSLAGWGGTVTDLSTTATGMTTITVSNTSSGSSNYGGTICNGSSRTLSLVLSGLGMLTLSGSNTYTGGTTVSGGTLDFAGPAATPSEGILTVNPGGYVVLGALVGASSPATDATETAADSSETSETVAMTFPASAGGVVASGGGASLGGTDSMTEVVPAAAVPEPSTIILLAAAAVGLLGYAWQRRRRTA